MNQELERHYVRHPSDVPITCRREDIGLSEYEFLKNVSEGGLAFMSASAIELGAIVTIQIPKIDPHATLQGIIVWCSLCDDCQYEIGVRFVDENNHFRMRMVEQICHIEHFKNEILETEGRVISGEEAAIEWIKRYAKDFPR